MSCFLSYTSSITGDCTNTNLGAFTIYIDGAAPDYTIQWLSPTTGTVSLGAGVTAYTQTNLSAGTYSFNIIDSCLPTNTSLPVNIYISSGTCVSITNIENEFPKEAKKAELSESSSAAAQGVVPGRTRISVASIFSKVSHDRQSKYPLMCEYLRNKFPEKPSGRLSIIFDFFENAPMSKEDLAEILDLFKQNLKAGYIGSEYESEIRYLQEEIDKK